MALQWDLTKIKDWSATCYVASTPEQIAAGAGPERLDPRLEIIIWQTIGIDMGSLTAENIDEWLWRIAFSKRVDCGAVGGIKPDGTKWWPTRDDLAQFIGLKVNVPTLPRAAWVARIADIISREVSREMGKPEELEAA